MMLRYYPERINRDIKIEDAIERYTHSRISRDGRHFQCPSPAHADNKPSATVKYNVCRCWSCGVSYNPISLYMDVLGVSFPDACKGLIEDFGLSMEDYSNIDEVRAEQEYKKDENRFPFDTKELDMIGLTEGASGFSQDYGKHKVYNFDTRKVEIMPYGIYRVETPTLHSMWKEGKKDEVLRLISDKCFEKKTFFEELAEKYKECDNELLDGRSEEILNEGNENVKYYGSHKAEGYKLSDEAMSLTLDYLTHKDYISEIKRCSDMVKKIEETEQKIEKERRMIRKTAWKGKSGKG